ncbi:DUF6541 family protein [Arthrobacter sp. MPF02]|uniref:DUF6541 family protein n=1 Tax=Arthrobacter sp. MPF02 TaxID=3388492 RepID=UPI003984B67D
MWLTAWLPLTAAATVLVLPGLFVGFAAGLRALSLLSLAPVLSLGVVSVSAVVGPYLGLSWGPVPVILGTLSASGLTWALRVGTGRAKGYPRAAVRIGYPATAATVAGLVLGSGVIAYRLARIFGAPSYVSQTADNVFHLNAVRYVLDSGNASSLALGAASGGPPSFYPGAWHGLAALVVQASGTSIPGAVACLNIAVGCLVWPLSMWFLCRTLFGGSAVVNLAFGVLIGAFSAYPYLLVDWGVIYPNYLGLAALPAVSGLVVLLFRNGIAASSTGPMLVWVACIGTAGVTLSHPNSLLTLFVLAIPYLIFRATRRPLLTRLSKPLSRQGRGPLFAAIGVMCVFITAWFILRPFPFTSFNITWPPYESSAQALGEVLLTTHSGRKPAWATAILFVLGLFAATTHRGYRWMLWCAGAWGFLFVVVTAWQPSLLRAFITGGWYDDYKRIAAGLVLIALPVAVLGSAALFYSLKRVIGAIPKVPTQAAAAASLLLITVTPGLAAHTGSVRDAAIEASKNYSLRPGSPIMSPDELYLYEELPDLVPADKVIAGNPWDGSAWAYLVSGRQVLFPHVIPFMDADKALIASSFRDALSNPAVCGAANRLQVKYAINSDELIYLPGNPNNRNYPGLEHLDKAPGFREVARVGANRLYEFEGC